MSQLQAIERSEAPATVTSLCADFTSIGLEAGATVMVHSSLSALGYVAGGAHAVVTALLAVLGPNGTLVMPTHTGELSDPKHWQNPPVPESWWPTIRAEMPAFDPALSPTTAMGAVVECFRHVAGVVRSAHPAWSAAAVGPNADAIIDGHELDHGFGESSPQARLYELDAQILLLGVTHANNTSLHLAQYRAAPADEPVIEHGSPVIIDGKRSWHTYAAIDDDTDDFEQIGIDFAAAGHEQHGAAGIGTARLMRSRDLVDFGANWMRRQKL